MTAKPITFRATGQYFKDADGSEGVRIAAASRDAGSGVHSLVALPGKDVVEITIAGGNGKPLKLVMHPDNARLLLASQAGNQATRGLNAVAAASDQEVAVPLAARWQLPAQMAEPASRSLVGDLVFAGLKILGIDPRAAAVNATVATIAGWRDGRVSEGVYRLGNDMPKSLKGAPQLTTIDAVVQPQLVLVHGTFSDTPGTFAAWWREHPGVVRNLFEAYGDQVYALDHATLGTSPIANALTLAKALPDNARLHLVTHSRGGLVAEVLTRACAGISATDLDFFEGLDYADYKRDLKALGDVLKGRGIRVERLVRVACPAHGTYLASNRLDTYFSVLGFLLDRAGVPMGSDVTDLLNEVARQRLQAKDFPGLESMVPERPLTLWLNSPCPPLPGDLRVVAGDVEPDLLEAWIRTLVAYAAAPLFRDDNDLVVQTSSMYGGAPRQGNALFHLESSPLTDHLHYFSNAGTANAIRDALLMDAPLGFAEIGPLSRAGASASGNRAVGGVSRGPRPTLADDGSLPAVVLLPGIMGTHLRNTQNEREWMVWYRLWGVVDRMAWPTALEPDGSVEEYYGALMDHLAGPGGHHVVEFGYDWRAPLEASADKLADVVGRLLDARKGTGQPVRVLGHSMGGLVARVMALRRSSTWTKMMANPGARFVMLGTPNAGSWAPMAVFTGDDKLGRFLSTFGGALAEFSAREKMAAFEGFVQMLAGLDDPARPLGNRQHWIDLARLDQQATQGNPWLSEGGPKSFYQWAIPTQAALSSAKDLRAALDQQAQSLGSDAQRIALVLGEHGQTLCGLTAGPDGVDYQATPEGDGRVPWASSLLPNVRTWKIGYAHGDLANAREHFGDFVALLEGKEPLLARPFNPPRTRGAAEVAAASPITWTGRPRDTAPTQLLDEAALFSAALGGANSQASYGAGRTHASRTLAVEVMCGDLKFVQEPLLVGHSRALVLTGSEKAVDQLLGGALSDALLAGLYPVEIGHNQVFVNTRAVKDNPWGLRRPKAVVVVGLGSEGELKAARLRETVRQGVLAYARHVAQHHAEAGTAAQPLVLAITSVGSGGALSVGESVSMVVRGALEANDVIAAAGQKAAWPTVSTLKVIELYESRAVEAWHTLCDTEKGDQLPIRLHPSVKTGKGGLRQPLDANYRGTTYDLVRITKVRLLKAATGDGKTQTEDVLEYSLSTRRARAEVRVKANQRALVAELVKRAESLPAHDPELSRSLFQLLVPLELRAYLGTSRTLMLELDTETASYPWEMLDDADPASMQKASGRPLGLREGGSVLRQFRTAEFRRTPMDSPGNEVLMVGASNLKQFKQYALADLPAVRTEVASLQKLLKSYQPTVVLDQPFDRVVKPLLAKPWKVVHLSGHGLYEPDGQTGMLIADGLVLGPAEFESMDSVPELVFVNCCSLGKAEDRQTTSHGQLAANVAEQLIRMGVRCVVATGWAVDDVAAAAFADAFYSALMRGKTFDMAVCEARETAWNANKGSNTWAAYQCYGDPGWRLTTTGAANAPRHSERPNIATAAELRLHLDNLAERANNADDQYRRELVDQLKQLININHGAAVDSYAQWLEQGSVAESVAVAWQNLNERELAISWFDKALKASDGTASFKAREQQLNLRARLQNASLESFHAVAQELVNLINLAPTAERWNLLGSTYKRAAMKMKADSAARADTVERLEAMAAAYGKAIELDRDGSLYATTQNLLARLCAYWQDASKPKPKPSELQTLRELRQLAEQVSGPSFWTTVAEHEQMLIEALLGNNLAKQKQPILSGFADVHSRVSNPHLWGSVADTAKFLFAYSPAKPNSAERNAQKQVLLILDGYSR